MKNLKLFILLAFMSLAVVSCNKDDDNNDDGNNPSGTVVGQFSFDGTNYNLRSGTIEDYGTDGNNISNFDITLFDKNLNFQNDDFAFEGDLVNELYFEIFTEEANKIPNGTYTFSSTDNAAGTFSTSSSLILDYNFTTDEEGTYIDFTAGTITVIQNGPVYELEFTLTTSGGKTVTGDYEGALVEFQE